MTPAKKPITAKMRGSGASVLKPNSHRGTDPAMPHAAAHVKPIPIAPRMGRSHLLMIPPMSRPGSNPLMSRALTQGDEELVQLIERLDHCIGCSGAGSVERFLRRITLAQDHQRLAALFLEG